MCDLKLAPSDASGFIALLRIGFDVSHLCFGVGGMFYLHFALWSVAIYILHCLAHASARDASGVFVELRGYAYLSYTNPLISVLFS